MKKIEGNWGFPKNRGKAFRGWDFELGDSLGRGGLVVEKSLYRGRTSD